MATIETMSELKFIHALLHSLCAHQKHVATIMSELKFIHALFPLQLGIAICYQYESAYFPMPFVDNQLLCSSVA